MKVLTGHRGEMIGAALLNLSSNPDFNQVREWLDKSLEGLKDQLIDTRGDNTLLAQGYSDALRDITTAFNNPRKILDNIKAYATRDEMQSNLVKATQW